MSSGPRAVPRPLDRLDPGDSHPYFVIFDRPIPWPSRVLAGDQPPIPLWASHSGADELKPIGD